MIWILFLDVDISYIIITFLLENFKYVNLFAWSLIYYESLMSHEYINRRIEKYNGGD